MKRPDIKVEVAFGLQGTRVWIDGKPIGGVVDIQFQHPVDEMPSIVLKLQPRSVEINGSATELDFSLKRIE